MQSETQETGSLAQSLNMWLKSGSLLILSLTLIVWSDCSIFNTVSKDLTTVFLNTRLWDLLSASVKKLSAFSPSMYKKRILRIVRTLL